MADKLPRGSVKPATAAVVAAATDFGHDDLIAGNAETLARAAVTAALPAIRRAALREAAGRILLLDSLYEGRICPVCFGDTAERRWPRPNRCAEGHEYPSLSLKSPYGSMRTYLRKLARGEPLPDLPAKEGDR
jgi:hypothetical protein